VIVITLTRVPSSLRGDLTKWYQEIQTGVYVGNVSARIRDELWDRILKNIGSGQATMVFNARNEFGYQFRTTRNDSEVVDFDGIPLLKHLVEAKAGFKPGFSTAAKMHRARNSARQSNKSSSENVAIPIEESTVFVSLDVETTGLEPASNKIISIGCVLHDNSAEAKEFYELVKIDTRLPKDIIDLTHLTDNQLSAGGSSLVDVLSALVLFVGDAPIVGYNLHFDDEFLTVAFEESGLPLMTNQLIDIMPTVKREQKFLDNYRLATVLEKYGIQNTQPHNSLADARATMALAAKLIENGQLKI
jgi:CRISPR-associated protein Cas2